jgi:hypothetical protein
MNTVRGLAIEVAWFDEHMLELRLSVSNGKFAGETSFYAALDEPKKFAARIEGFPNAANDSREHEFGGTGLSEYGGAKVRLACKDGSGHLTVRVDVVADLGPQLGVDSASVHFDALPAAIDRFVEELRNMGVEVGRTASLPYAV